jgi:aspartyl-tRNA(Asn)/glutamyl-tRNA(Gln) amidotransferase subunit C
LLLDPFDVFNSLFYNWLYMIEISKEEVLKVAQLARLELSETEVEKYQKELSAILGYVDVLNKVDLSDVAATAQVTGLLNVYAEDKKKPSFDRDELLKNAPERQDGYYRVKPVLE